MKPEARRCRSSGGCAAIGYSLILIVSRRPAMPGMATHDEYEGTGEEFQIASAPGQGLSAMLITW